jgi:hypothetical protein
MGRGKKDSPLGWNFNGADKLWKKDWRINQKKILWFLRATYDAINQVEKNIKNLSNILANWKSLMELKVYYLFANLFLHDIMFESNIIENYHFN